MPPAPIAETISKEPMRVPGEKAKRGSDYGSSLIVDTGVRSYCYNIVAMSKKSKTPRGDVGSAEFKARCLELVDHVREARAEYVVTRHGRPVARLVPVADTRPAGFIGSMAGTVLGYDAPFEPVPGAWSVNAPAASDA